MKLHIEKLNLEQAIFDYASKLGKEGTRRLAEKLSVDVKNSIPTLSEYGKINAQKNLGADGKPHPYRAKPNEIKDSTTVVESKKYDDSYLVNVRDWRAHFMEYPTQAHDRKPRHAKAMKFVKPDNHNAFVYAKGTLHHPGTKGAGIFERISKDTALIEKYVREIAAELGASI